MEWMIAVSYKIPWNTTSSDKFYLKTYEVLTGKNKLLYEYMIQL